MNKVFEFFSNLKKNYLKSNINITNKILTNYKF